MREVGDDVNVAAFQVAPGFLPVPPHLLVLKATKSILVARVAIGVVCPHEGTTWALGVVSVVRAVADVDVEVLKELILVGVVGCFESVEEVLHQKDCVHEDSLGEVKAEHVHVAFGPEFDMCGLEAWLVGRSVA